MTIDDKIDKYEYLTGEEILPSDQSRIIDDSKKLEEKIKREDLIYGSNKCKHDFQKYETIRSFGESIYW